MTKRASYLNASADFGLAVRQSRLDRGLSQKELSEIIAAPQSAISEIESGKVTIYIQRLLSLFTETGVQLTATWEADDRACPLISTAPDRSARTPTPIASRHVCLHHRAGPLPKQRSRIGGDESSLPAFQTQGSARRPKCDGPFEA